MRWIKEGWRRIRLVGRHHEMEGRLDEEIRFHVDQQIEKNLAAGMSPNDARRQAMVRFGGTERVKETTRDEFRSALLQDSIRDFRYSLRALRRAPGFTLISCLTLALGIGATTAVFSVVNGVLIKPLPYLDADALVRLNHTVPGLSAGSDAGIEKWGMSPALLSTYRDENRTFEELGVWSNDSAYVTDVAEPEEVQSLHVSHGTLQALAVRPLMGRWFSARDHEPGSPETVMLTYGYWQQRYGGDASVIGRRLTIDSQPRTVVGVMPKGFRFLNEDPDLILPFRFEPEDFNLGRFNHAGLARLKPGVSLEQANADVARMIPIWLGTWPSFPGIDRTFYQDLRLTPALEPLKQGVVGDVDRVLWVVMGTIAIVLLIACANVANLLLVRAEGRQQELAIRAALGAGWGRIAREMLLESLVLALVGGALGLALAFGAVRVLAAIGPATLPRLQEITVDPTVLAFALLVSVLSGLLFGLIPVVKQAAPQITTALHGGGRTASDSRERHRARNTLVVVQVALALLLLVGSGLMIRTFMALHAVQPGFADPHHVQLARIIIFQGDAERVFRMQCEIRDRLAAIPGVSAASFANATPMSGRTGRSVLMTEEQQTAAEASPWFRRVVPGYFQAVGTPIVAGRDLTWAEVYDHRRVAVISENLARELWHEPAAALGKQIRESTTSPFREIIGVVGDVHENGVREAAPSIVYWPVLMENFFGDRVNVARVVTFVVRSDRAGSESFLDEISDAIWSVNRNVPLAQINTLGEVYEGSLARTSFTLVMLAIAAGMALLLGVVGIYGVIAYAVTQRTREIGIRVALGAQRVQVKRMFVRQGLALTVVGVVCGLASAAVLTRLMTSLLFGTSPLDLTTYVAVSLVLLAAAALASYVPAHRAASVDPMTSLRAE